MRPASSFGLNPIQITYSYFPEHTYIKLLESITLMRPIRIKREKRMCDAVSFRVLPEQRAFLEKIAKENNVGLCEAGRIVIDAAMARAGAEA